MTVAAACEDWLAATVEVYGNAMTYLMIWEDQCIRDNDVLSSSSSKDYDLGDVVWCERLATTVCCQYCLECIVSIEHTRRQHQLWPCLLQI